METSERNIEANMNELIGRIEAKYEKMSKGQKRLAEYVKENYDKAVFLTAARLGEIVGVSESTVVRFATQLGYRGYLFINLLMIMIQHFFLLCTHFLRQDCIQINWYLSKKC